MREPSDCHCLCARWQHVGICTGAAETALRFSTPELGTVDVPLCYACAAAILAHGFEVSA